MSPDNPTLQTTLTAALEGLHARLAQELLTLPTGAVAWQPSPETPSPLDTVTRALQSERYWIAQVIERVDATPSAECTEQPVDRSREELLLRLGCTGQISQTVLATLPPAEWDAARTVAGETFSVTGCVLRAFQEVALALGQLQVVAQLWRASHVAPADRLTAS